MSLPLKYDYTPQAQYAPVLFCTGGEIVKKRQKDILITTDNHYH